MNTYVPKAEQVRREWWLVDAEGMTLGRLASTVASRLRGKHKPTFTPFLDTGDHVIVINAAKVVLSGKKLSDKIYRRHSGYPGGLKEIRAGQLLARYPERLVEYAVKGMLPKGPLGRRMLRKLRVYPGGSHPHQAQRPADLAIDHARRGRQGWRSA